MGSIKRFSGKININTRIFSLKRYLNTFPDL